LIDFSTLLCFDYRFLFKLVPYLNIAASNGYAFQIDTQNYRDSEIYQTISGNIYRVHAITIETLSNTNFRLTDTQITSVDASDSFCTY
jgi:hypothetical protein